MKLRGLRVSGLIALLFVFNSTVQAQETPQAEFFGGYSYFGADGGSSLHGWHASVAGNLNRWLGLAAEFSGHYGSDRLVVEVPGVISVRADVDSSVHTFLFGPRISYREYERFTPFGHVLIGVARARIDGAVDVPPFPGSPSGIRIDVSETESGFAAAIGGGVDVMLTEAFALRLIQADYVPVRIGGQTNHNARLSAGIVFRFGVR